MINKELNVNVFKKRPVDQTGLSKTNRDALFLTLALYGLLNFDLLACGLCFRFFRQIHF